MRKVKIIIFPGYYLPHIGGLETHVDEFVKYLSKDKNFEITIFSPNIPMTKEREIIFNKVNVIRYPAFEIISNYPLPKFWKLSFWKLFFGLYKKDYDIVMTRTRFFSNSLLGLILAKFRFRKIKLIHVEHGSDFVKLDSKFKSKIAYFYDMIFGALVFRLSDKVIAISHAVKNFVCNNFVNCKKREISIIYRGVDFEIYKDVKKDLKLKNKFRGKIMCGYVGRLYKWKGVENTINAVKKFPKNIKEKIVFLVVGYGEDEDRLKELAGEELNKTIFFLGRKSFRDAISFLKTIDIYIHSSYPGGGLSNSLLQAMYCGCAVVASPNEGANEVVNDKNGLLLRNNSSLSIKKGIVELVNNHEKIKTFKKEARKTIIENFNWEDNVDKYKNIFYDILK